MRPSCGDPRGTSWTPPHQGQANAGSHAGVGSDRDHQSTADADAHLDAKRPLRQWVSRLVSSRRLVLGGKVAARVIGPVTYKTLRGVLVDELAGGPR